MTSPYNSGFLAVGDGHRLYYEESGNPLGRPIVFLHGGPGGGMHGDMRRFFDPSQWRVILYDQRGAGRSTPHAGIADNTPAKLVEDLETLRKFFGIERWTVAGMSWGSALAMLYAAGHADRIDGMILCGIFLADRHGAERLLSESGAGWRDIDRFRQFCELIPHARTPAQKAKACLDIMCGDKAAARRELALRFALYNRSISLQGLDAERKAAIFGDPERYEALLTLFCAYTVNHYTPRNRALILETAARLGHIPAVIIHAEDDWNCPVDNAEVLHAHWLGSRLVRLEEGGHNMRDPVFADAVCDAAAQLFRAGA